MTGAGYWWQARCEEADCVWKGPSRRGGFGGHFLEARIELDDFKGSVDFVNRLTPEAENMNHHPDLDISWNKVTVTVTTHSEGGLTDNDFELAKRIDAVS